MRSLGLLGKIVLLASAMVLITGLSAWVVFSFLTRGGEVTVPDVRGMDMQAALEITSREKLGLSIASSGFDPSIPPGHIMSQAPDPGVRTRRNRIVRVVVSQGTRTVHIPDLADLNLRRAELQLSQAGLKIGQVARSHDPDTEAGSIITQLPSPGDFVARGEAVNVLVSEGHRPLTYLLPDMTGYSAEEVLPSIRAWGLKTGRLLEVESTDLPPGTVKALQPPPGSAVSQGQTVHLTVTTTPGPHKPSPIVLYRYTSPRGLLDRNLKLVLVREDGESIVYDKDVPPGTSITVPVTVSEEAILKVYLNGSLLEEREVP